MLNMQINSSQGGSGVSVHTQDGQRIGLIGHPVAHSRSPAMQQAALDALGIPARYELWDTTPHELPARVAALRQPGMLGANVTIPYKAAVVPLLDAITPEARRTAGVVNTIVREETPTGVRLVGHNTDVTALGSILDEHAVWGERGRVVVLGAGGAAQAALGAARQRGAEVWVAARRPEAAVAALDALWAREHSGDVGSRIRPMPGAWRQRALALGDTGGLAEALAAADVLLQATPVGMERTGESGDGEASPLPLALLDRLPARAFVFDLVYAPPETALVRAARARGLRALGGLPMLLYQGAAAFTLWTGRAAPLDIMRDALGA
jgi:shikimate dehydrogenase